VESDVRRCGVHKLDFGQLISNSYSK
jgi:hypothetical protein